MSEPSEAELAVLLVGVAHAFAKHGRARLAGYGATVARSRVLLLLRTRGPLRLGDVADVLNVAARTITDVVDGLVALGWVERFTAPDDRRAVLVQLTDLGRSQAKALDEVNRQLAQEFFAPLDPRGQLDLAVLLRQLAAGELP